MIPRLIALVPIGEVPQDLLRWLEDALEESLDADVRTLAALPFSPAWVHSQRKQARGSELLGALKQMERPQEGRVLGLIDVDCYGPGLNFIFGQADPRAGVALVALPRLRPSFYGLTDDGHLFRQRVLKEAVHEFGHTWGLSHCPNPRCVMRFSNTLADTDAKGSVFCKRCRRRLQDERMNWVSRRTTSIAAVPPGGRHHEPATDVAHLSTFGIMVESAIGVRKWRISVRDRSRPYN
jgi:archaemetzincin